MADITSVDLARVTGGGLEQARPDLLRAMVKTFAEALMGAEADAICGAPYGMPSPERVNVRNGTGTGTSTPGTLDWRPTSSAWTQRALLAGWLRRAGPWSRLSL